MKHVNKIKPVVGQLKFVHYFMIINPCCQYCYTDVIVIYVIQKYNNNILDNLHIYIFQFISW